MLDYAATETRAASVVGSGTGYPNSLRPAMWMAIPSRMSCSASSRVSPTIPRPGRSGHSTPTAIFALFEDDQIIMHLFVQTCLSENTLHGAFGQVFCA